MFWSKTDIGKIKRIEQWFKSEGRKLLVYHRDVDGVCSAALILRFFPDFTHITREGPRMDQKFLNFLVSRKPDLIVFSDIPVDQEYKKVMKLKKKLRKVKIAVIDHHLPEKDMSGRGVVHINPRFTRGLENKYIPASCVVYDIFRQMGYPVKPYVWVAAVGVIGDYGFDDCKDLLEECERVYPGSISDKPGKCKMTRISEMLASLMTLKGSYGAKKSLEVVMECNRMEKKPDHRELSESYKIVKEKIKRIMEDFEKNKEVYKDLNLIMYRIESKMSIASIMATKITERYPDKIILIRKKSIQGWKISLRCQSRKVNVGDLAKKASKGIGSGGGHPKSAGALIRNWETFKERVFEELKRV